MLRVKTTCIAFNQNLGLPLGLMHNTSMPRDSEIKSLTLLLSEWPKLYGVLAILCAIGLSSSVVCKCAMSNNSQCYCCLQKWS